MPETMNLFRDTSGAAINRIWNDPNVKPGVIDDERFLDLSKMAADPRCHALIGEPALGSYLCWQLVEGVYECHVGVLPQGRGEWALKFTEAAIRQMFCTTDAIELVTRIPQGALGSLALVRRFGFVERWVCGSVRYRGRAVPYSVWSLTMFDWFPADPAGLNAVVQDMKRGGMERKAAAWFRRWALLSGAEGGQH